MIPSGLCQCGCGQKTNIADGTDASKGWVKGEPLKYVFGHQARGKYRPRILKRYAVDPSTGCWIWLLRCDENGYAVGSYKGRRRNMHEAMWEEKNGPVPEGLELDHLCRNRPCINPSHLEPVTRAINTQRGTCAKLKPEQVVEIRRRWAECPSTSLKPKIAQEFKVSVGAVHSIIIGRTWVNLLTL